MYEFQYKNVKFKMSLADLSEVDEMKMTGFCKYKVPHKLYRNFVRDYFLFTNSKHVNLLTHHPKFVREFKRFKYEQNLNSVTMSGIFKEFVHIVEVDAFIIFLHWLLKMEAQATIELVTQHFSWVFHDIEHAEFDTFFTPESVFFKAGIRVNDEVERCRLHSSLDKYIQFARENKIDYTREYGFWQSLDREFFERFGKPLSIADEYIDRVEEFKCSSRSVSK